MTFYSQDKETKVKGFGVNEKFTDGDMLKRRSEIIKQVEILYYDEKEGHIIRLKSLSPKDEIILARVGPKETLLKTVEFVQEFTKNAKPQSMGADVLQIPEFNFNIAHSYVELHKKDLKNLGWESYFVDKTYQNIQFGLNKKGVDIKSEARCYLGAGPRYLVFWSPFLLYLKEKGAKYPYFAMWVENAELMVKE